MDDFPHDDPILGPSIVTFDGHVLELFTERSGSVARLVAGMIFLQVDDPDRKGRREVWFTCGPNRRGGGFRLMFGEEQWPGFEPWLREFAGDWMRPGPRAPTGAGRSGGSAVRTGCGSPSG